MRQRICLLLLSIAAVTAAVAQAPPTQVSLLHAESQVRSGTVITVGIRFLLPPGWHLYWTNPGDAGQAPSVQWVLPFGWSAGALQWPTPARLVNSAGVDYGYENEVTLLTPLKVGAIDGELVANLKWLVCKDICVPQNGTARTVVHIGANSVNPAAQQVMDNAKASLPHTVPPAWKANAFQNPGQLMLNFRPGIKVMQATFFPEDREVIENAASQQLSSTSYAAQLTMKKAASSTKISRLKGVLVVNGTNAYQVDVPVK